MQLLGVTGMPKFSYQGVYAPGVFVRAWPEGRGRAKEYCVQVWLKDNPIGDPEGDWAMPGVLGIAACIAQAVL